jgi:hypothetical protein
MNRLAINLLAFQIGWFSCVLGAANGYPLLGPLTCVAVVIVHIWLTTRPLSELALIALTGLLGVVFDSLLLRSGWLSYANGTIWAGIAPHWIIAMWLSFATTLNVSLRWLRGRIGVALAVGAVGGPVSYLAGEQLGALAFVATSEAIAALAIGWGAVLPLLIWLSEQLDVAPASSAKVPQHA